MESEGFNHSKQSILESFRRNRLKRQIELHKENEFCDLILKNEDGLEIKVHKFVVSSASDYFKDLLTLPMKEKMEECITIPGIAADVLEKIITFIYTCEFKEKIEDVEKIIKYAVIFQLDELVEICLLALSKSINDLNCVKYWRLAGNNLINSLEDKCLAYIIRKADHLFETSLLSDLTISEMRSLLATNRLHLQCDEEIIFEHVWKWAEGKVSETKSFSQVFSEVVDLFNYAELQQEFILSRIFFNDDLTENAEILQKIAKLTKQKYKDEIPSRLIFHKSAQRRLFGLASNKMFIGLGEKNTIQKEIKLRHDFGYTTFDNKLLICGGMSTSCDFFEQNKQQWRKFPSMKTKKQGHQCLHLDNIIYACGGDGSKTVEIFDLGKGEWDYGPELLTNRCWFGLTGVNGALYAIGGESKNVEILDPRAQKWSVVCSDFQPDSEYLRCVSIGPCIYCYTYYKRYIFDTRSNKFTEEACCKDFNWCFNCCELDGYIYGFGYQKSAEQWSLNLVQYHLDGKQGFNKSFGLYNEDEVTEPAIISLYY